MSEHDHNFPPEPVPRQRRPAGQALVVIIVTMLVACLLNADRLSHTAHTQPFGSWQRTWAIRLTDPLKSVSHLTGLNRPRKWLSHAVGNDDPPPPRDTSGIVIQPLGEERDPDAPPTTTTTTRPKPVRTPTQADPVRILVAGDSLMGWIAPALTDLFGSRPVKIVEDFKVGTGLARPDVINWPDRLEQDIEANDPEVIVVGFGGNDAQDMSTSDGIVRVGTKAWQTEYQKRVAQILDVVEDHASAGFSLKWIGLPMTTRSNIEEAAPAMRRVENAEIDARPWAHYIDSRKILSPDGTYTAYLPDGNGDSVKVREGDGVHPNLAGAKRIVTPLVEDLIRERKLL